MHGITFNHQTYLIDGKPAFLYSGEFHYFRVPRADWRRRMALFREAGGNCVATYIPWLIHEPVEGQITFEAGGHLDFESFLQTAHEVGLYVIARPGPYQYSELVYAGLPRWLYDDYPGLRAQRLNGDPIGKGSVSYVHPLFLEKVGRWFDAVCPIISRYSVSRGGPIALTQFDNELTGFHLWLGSMDFNPESMDFGQAGGRYPKWLRHRYGEIAVLNASYESHYCAFEDVRPVISERPSNPFEFRAKKDYFDFYLGTVAEYASTLVGMMRQRGIDTPFIHNSANPDMNAYFRETVEALGAGFLLGSDHYYNLDQTWNQNNPTPQYAINIFCSNEMLRLFGFPPTVLEMPCGSAADWPPITPEDMKACVLANLALGMKGCNYYIFTGGPNPKGAGVTTDIYDYGAAIRANGEVGPLYEVVKEIGQFLQAETWLAEAERVHDVRVSLDLEQARAHRYGGSGPGSQFSGEQAWSFTRKGLLTTAFCSSLSPIFIDLGSDQSLDDISTPLVIICTEGMARARQERIVRFLSNGGKALIAPLLPKFDENLQPCSILSDHLESLVLVPNGEQVRLNLDTVTNVFNNGQVYFSERMPASASVLMTDELSGKAVSWSLSLPKNGKVVFLGFHWLHSKLEHGQMLVRLLQELGWKQKVFCSNPNLWTSLRRRGDQSMLFVLNLSTSSMHADIRYSMDDDWVEHRGIKMEPMTVHTFSKNRKNKSHGTFGMK